MKDFQRRFTRSLSAHVMAWVAAAIAVCAGARARAADGDLDNGFGSAGIVAESFGGDAEGGALAMQGDGAIVVTGTFTPPGGLLPPAMVVARYTAAGALDPTFNSTGYLFTADAVFGGAGRAVAIQSDDKIVAVALIGAGTQYLGTHIARFDPQGVPDSTFGTGGVKLFAGVPGDLAIVAGDRMVLSLVAPTASPFDIELKVLRFLPDGSPDPTFGTGGSALIDGFNFAVPPRIAVRADGRIVVVVENIFHSGPVNLTILNLLQLLADGSADTSFGVDGMVEIGVDMSATGVAVLNDGRIVVSASTSGGKKVFRFAADGSPDTTFGSSGAVTESFATTIADVEIASGDRILLAGGGPQLALARLRDDGSRDPAFGSGGVVTTSFGDSSSVAQRLVQQSDGKLVAIGTTGTGSSRRLVLARYLLAPPAPACVEMSDARLRAKGYLTPAGDDALRIKARLPLAPSAAVDPVTDGLRVTVRDANGDYLDVTVPGGAYDAGTHTGWKARVSPTSTSWRFKSPLPIGGAIQKIRLQRDASGEVALAITGSHGSFAAPPVVPPVTLSVALDGACGEAHFDGSPATCALSPSGAVLVCR